MEDANELGAKLIKAELMGDEELVASLKLRLEAVRKNVQSSTKPAEDLNELGAKLIKAELMGDEELVKSLKARLETARNNAAAVDNKSAKPATNRYDHQRQHQHNNNFQRHGGRSNQHHQHHNGHKKEAYMNDVDLEQAKLLKRNFHGDEYDDLGQNTASTERTDKNWKKKRSGAGGGGRASASASGGGMDATNSFTLDSKFQTTNPQNDQAVQNADTVTSLRHCPNCFDNVAKHLIISFGKHSYLSLPSEQSLCEGHCIIAPIAHQTNSVTCDEEVWNEMLDFRRALVRMYETKRMECVFYEQYSTNKRNAHLVVECLPLPYNVSNMAPIYFKKALMESESEWAQNKRVIELKGDQSGSIRRSVPKNMPYFCVNFGMDEGYAHIIENADAFADHFAKEVVGGILDLDPMIWRRPKHESFPAQSKKVIDFSKIWKPFDFNNSSKTQQK